MICRHNKKQIKWYKDTLACGRTSAGSFFSFFLSSTNKSDRQCASFYVFVFLSHHHFLHSTLQSTLCIDCVWLDAFLLSLVVCALCVSFLFSLCQLPASGNVFSLRPLSPSVSESYLSSSLLKSILLTAKWVFHRSHHHLSSINDDKLALLYQKICLAALLGLAINPLY